MITLQRLKWSNAFSYGADNEIDFADSKLIQLLGANGNGKSSVALILEEVLYNKNSKGIKKGDILNRHVDSKSYTIELFFDKNGVDSYYIKTVRGSTQTVKLFLNGEDISSHTATNTYKEIEKIIGIDHKTFCQIVCQSHASSLEFLTSADTARKKFLIELLNLGKYTRIGDAIRELATATNKEYVAIQSKLDTIHQWIHKYKDMDFNKVPLKIVPNLQEATVIEANSIKDSLDSIVFTNKKINSNNAYIQSKNNIDLVEMPEKPTEDIHTFVADKAKASQNIDSATMFRKKLLGLGNICPTCLQDINQDKLNSLVLQQSKIIDSNTKIMQDKEEYIKILQAKEKAWNSAKSSHEELERLHQLIDTSLPVETLNELELKTKLNKLRVEISSVKDSIEAIEKSNAEASQHNAKLDLIQNQITEMIGDAEMCSAKVDEISAKLFRLNTLVKAFSTTGLVAYKIENLAKDLEHISNNYLNDLSSGRFQISFQIAGSDKLNVVITDNGIDIQIEALSAGETTRVNVAVLLAIRKLMQSISDSRINLLFLDETISTLDAGGKEKLVEVLLAEDNLNTILVSHEFTHPLLEKLLVAKDKHISKIYRE